MVLAQNLNLLPSDAWLLIGRLGSAVMILGGLELMIRGGRAFVPGLLLLVLTAALVLATGGGIPPAR
jgi:hypothetical protein